MNSILGGNNLHNSLFQAGTSDFDKVQVCYFMMACSKRKRGRKGRGDNNGGGGNVTTSPAVGIRRRGSRTVDTDLMENINL
jgi:hypothetical protein